ncbi:MAG: fasciclin domain-containing protein [Bacteroidia bacterium]|nr:fasciclin domain-containing protein [Bacteroidia bacterium]
MKPVQIWMILALVMLTVGVRTQAQCQGNHHSATTQSTPPKKSGKTLVDLAVGSSDLTTLVAALKAAGLVETLQGKGPYTVFAPTNAAFAALPEGTVESLLKPENKAKLIAVLTYHVVPGRIEANDLSTGKVTSVEGRPIEVVVTSTSVRVNNAVVTTPDNRAVNGVVHIIDRVILPPGM